MPQIMTSSWLILPLLLMFFQEFGLAFVVKSPPAKESHKPTMPVRRSLVVVHAGTGDAGAPQESNESPSSRTIVVVGGGWAGFSAADALSTDPSAKVILLDASPRGQGGLAGGWRTERLNRPVEAGLHGFWREYKNTFATIERVGIIIDEALTPYTPSVLVSQSGRVALAPVLGKEVDADSPKRMTRDEITDIISNPSSTLQILADLLPPPLDVALLSDFASDSPLTVADRLSAIGLLGAWADFEQEADESWERYDAVSAENLFRTAAGLSSTLYQELVSPLLHVLPMTPGYDCSAAAALSCFHVFALQSKGVFDVRWCRGSIAETIFNPWALQLQSRGNVQIRGSSKVTSIVRKSHGQDQSQFEVTINNSTTLECDAFVMAVGATSMKRFVSCCPPLQEVAAEKSFSKLRGVTCVAVRLFLRPNDRVTRGLAGGLYNSSQLPPSVAQAMKDSPVTVCGPRVGEIPELSETGFCVYDLQRLHDEFAVVNQGKSDQEPCAALEIDFFRADPIANIKDDFQVAELALRAVAAALNIERINPDLILDVAVVRARDAVSHFCVKSASSSPRVRVQKGVYMCGDWIDRTGHASWSTEKAVVTGRQAASAVAKDLGLQCRTDVLPAASDTKQLSLLRQFAQTMRTIAPPPGSGIPSSPWVVGKQIITTFRQS